MNVLTFCSVNERDRQTDRQTDRDRDRETETDRQRDRQTEREREREREYGVLKIFNMNALNRYLHPLK